MKSFEKNSKWAFLAVLLGYLAFKIYAAIYSTEKLLDGTVGIASEDVETIKIVGVAGGVVGTLIFIAATYFIYRAVYRNINRENEKMLERFRGVYFSNMIVLYLGSAMAMVLSTFVFENQIWLSAGIGIAIKLLLILGINFIMLDGEDIKVAPNMATFAVLSLF